MGGESRVNEARINPLLNCEQLLWNSTDLYLQTSYQHIDSDGSGLTADVSGQAMSSTDEQIVAGVGMLRRFQGRVWPPARCCL